jgi:hypothetical protein
LVNLGNFAVIHLKPDCAITFLCELDCKRQTNVTEADYTDLRLFVCYSVYDFVIDHVFPKPRLETGIRQARMTGFSKG